MADKKAVTVTNRALIWFLGISLVVNVVLILSGLKFNPFLLLLVFGIAGFILFYFFRRNKKLDFYDVVRLIRKRHMEEFGYNLDPTDSQAILVAPEISDYFFPNEGLTFNFNMTKQKVDGIQIRHLFKAVKEQEKSGLFALTQKFMGMQAQLKHQAESIGVDTEKLGLENM